MTLRQLAESEAPDAARRAAVSMGGAMDEESVERWRERIATGTVWGLERDGVVAGQCRLLATDHWFGGRRVPCLDVSGVSVPPEHRGQGVAREMMDAAAARGREDGYGLSLLFPATTEVYRKLGWELAGARTRYRVSPRRVPAEGPPMRTASHGTDWPAIKRCHEQAARLLAGPAVRDDARWQELAEAPFTYVLDADDRPGEVDAYALVRQRHLEQDWRHDLRLVDWAATTLRGLQAITGLVGRWDTFGRDADFVDAVPSRWSALLPEQDLEPAALHWMARGLDLPAAVAARGFPQGLSLAVTLRVAEPRGAQGPWRLEVSDGRGRLAEARGADVRLDGHAFGPLFTGYRTARELQLLGLLHGPDEALELLDVAFSGPQPVLFDFF